MAGTSRRVVVTGMGALTPLGLSVEEYWRGLVEGESGAATIESFDPEGLRVTFACELDGFDPEDHLPAKQARRVDPFSQYALVTADQAVADAGLDPDDDADRETARTALAENPIHLFVPDHRVRDTPGGAPEVIADRLRAVES